MNETEKEQLRTNCLHLATHLVLRDDNGDASLTKDDILNAAKEFAKFVETGE